jgi:hypothetical protein
MLIAYRQIGDPRLVREILIPWTEEGLSKPGSESQWGWGIETLILAYEYLGEPEKAVGRGRYWLEQARERQVMMAHLDSAQLSFARVLGKTDYQAAAGMLRGLVVGSSGWVAEGAQAELLKLAEVHPDLTNVEILTPRFSRTSTEQLSVTVPFGQPISRKLVVSGNVTFRVTGGSCDLPGVKVGIGKGKMEECSNSQEVTLGLDAFDKSGPQDGNLVLETNDTQRGRITVPLHVEVASPIRVTPTSFFFGFVRPGETKTCTVTITGAVPFQVKEVKVDKPEVLKVTVTAQGDRRCELVAILQDLTEIGIREGTVQLNTDLPSQPMISVRYYLEDVSSG